MCVFTITGELFDLGPIMATPIIRQLLPKCTESADGAGPSPRYCTVGTLAGHSVCELLAVLTTQMRNRDWITAMHQERVCALSIALAKELHLADREITGIAVAAMLHDVGKAVLPAEILHKVGKLTARETSLMHSHPENGAELLRDVSLPWPVKEAILQHHERQDGSGYPHGLTDDEICIGARIIGVADVVEAMASDRPYRSALPLACVAEHIASSECYDRKVADACVALYERGELASYVEPPHRLRAS